MLTIIAIVFGCAFVIYVRLKYGAIYAAFAITVSGIVFVNPETSACSQIL